MSSSGAAAAALPGRCPGVTKQGTPCSITWDLLADGFCKFHSPSSLQCLGTSRSSGQRCRIRWDLDTAGYCGHHRYQAPVPAPVPPSSSPTCRGLTKHGSPCSVTWGLDADGFCKYHVPSASRCRGLARATGRRCKIKWNLDERGYCQFHRRVDAPITRQCEALLTGTGRRCLQTVGIDDDGFCTAHRAVRKELPVCQGVLPGSSKRCRNNAKTDYDYCCAAHDPEFAASFVAPSLFNAPGLRSSVEGDIVKRFQSRDLYHGDKLDLNTVGAVELDHILEKQCFAHAFQRVEFRGGDEEVEDVAFLLREEIVNELPNLCLTRATTNKIKGAAVSRFLDDSLTGHRGAKTFTDYLLEEKRDGTRLACDVTRAIRSEMGAALRRCQRMLADTGETPALDALSAELQQLYVDMELHTSSSTKTKPKLATPATTTAGLGDTDDEYVLVDSVSSDSWTVVDDVPTVKIKARLPELSADAKPFVPGASHMATIDPLGDVKAAVEHFKNDPCEVKTKSEEVADIRVKAAKEEVTSSHQTSRQVTSEPTSEVKVKKDHTSKEHDAERKRSSK